MIHSNSKAGTEMPRRIHLRLHEPTPEELAEQQREEERDEAENIWAERAARLLWQGELPLEIRQARRRRELHDRG